MAFFVKTDDSAPKKKLITLQNHKIIEQLVKDEGSVTGSSDSVIFENAILNRYLNTDNDISYATINFLLQEHGIAKTCESIFNLLSASPQKADDSILGILDFIHSLELRNRTIVKADDKVLSHLAGSLKLYYEVIQRYQSVSGLSFEVPGQDAQGRITFDDMIVLKDLCRIEEDPNNINCGTYIAILINEIKKFWYLGGDNGNVAMKNWTHVYRILSDICSLAKWPDLPQYRHEFTTILKEIKFAKGSEELFDPQAPILEHHVWLKNKALLATKDVVILKTDDNLAFDEFRNAYRIIHGPNGKITERPYIILSKNESAEEVEAIVQSKIASAAPEEFIDSQDAYIVQILFNGVYYDKRLRWLTT